MLAHSFNFLFNIYAKPNFLHTFPPKQHIAADSIQKHIWQDICFQLNHPLETPSQLEYHTFAHLIAFESIDFSRKHFIS